MSIIKKSNGKYTVDIVNEHGKRIQRTFIKKAEADAFESAIIRSKYENKLVTNKLINARYSISQSIEEYRSSKNNLRPGSIKAYKAVIDFIVEFVNANKIQYLDEFDTNYADLFYKILITERTIDLQNHKRVIKAKPKTVNFYLSTIKELFKREILKDRLVKSPFAHIKNLKVERPRPEYYTKNELVAFFNQPMHKAYYDAFKGFLLTGMRFQELASLRVSDINLKDRLISVSNKLDFTTKTTNAIRLIPISDELYKIISELITNLKDDDYVFKSPKGNKLRERSLLEVCKRVSKKAEISSRAFIHKFRHTFATILVQNDVPLETIKELLGHSSVVETEIYAHNKTDHRHHQIKILDKLFDNENKKITKSKR